MRLFKPVPAIMYHHVNREPEDSVTISPEKFEAEIKHLHDSGYTPLFLPEYFDAVYGKARAPEKPVLITFDDGYFDNLTFAFPILKKYGFKATIFVITSRPFDRVPSRSPSAASHSEIEREGIKNPGAMAEYLTWEEMKKMESTGLIDIQSHTHTHWAYFDGDKVLDFYDGKAVKPGFATVGDFRPGIPLYHIAPALVAKRYFDDVSFRDHMADLVSKNGGVSFFDAQKAMEKLFLEAKKYAPEIKGHFETEAEHHARVIDEPNISKQTIENKLNKKCEYICWPWGSVDKKTAKLAMESGYKGGVGMRGGCNIALTDRMSLHRFNGSQKEISVFKQKLFKYSGLFLSLYNDDKIDAVLIPAKNFS